ncbi:hypothetical protein CAPTEDRAFT_205145 [Capitella teleta]|uniref:Uncharacterized protein n=1 Tax=Capitella teleta TaxID=283909 RepID=R7TSG3_CAPTE|nr:hypothetical protein CAPTEDRAFT_205145 [Capitella teleta]|eukprot:ELT96813.1 hypothetical protein CAPTEDRAFT_205145 [Capitella teleta]
MSFLRAIQVELQGENNETFYGTLTLEATILSTANETGTLRNASDGDASTDDLEADPVGASTYVIAVVLIYGLSIVFLIGSHVVLRGRENYRDVEKQIDKFLRQAPVVKEKNAKDNYKNLKHSIIPVVALSSARDLVSRRKSFAAFLVGLHPPPTSASRRDDQRISDDPAPSGVSSTVDEDAASGRMPTIEEEESAEELDRSQGSVGLGKAIKHAPKEEADKKRNQQPHFYLGETSGTHKSLDSLHDTSIPTSQSWPPPLPEAVSPAVSDAWLFSQRASQNSPSDSKAQETEQLLHVTCVEILFLCANNLNNAVQVSTAQTKESNAMH